MVEQYNNNFGHGGQTALFVEPSAPLNTNNLPPPPPSQPPQHHHDQYHHPPPLPPAGSYNPNNQCGDGSTPAAGYPYPPPPQPHHQQSSNVTANVYMASAAAIPVHSGAGGIFAVVDQRPAQLPCCGIGLGWFLFILGFFFALPWYIGAGALVCSKYDKREKVGYIACAVMGLIFVILIIISATRPAYVY